MRNRIGLIAAALLGVLFSFGAAAQGPGGAGPGGGPGPAPSPWISAGSYIYYNNGGAVMPASVTGGSQGIGTINVSSGYYVGGVNISALPCTQCAVKNATNTFIAKQIVNLNAASADTAQTGTIIQLSQADTVISRVELDTYGASAHVTGIRADGTKASPTTLVANDEIVSLNAWGYDGTSRSGPAAAFRIYAGGTWSNTSHQTYTRISATASGSTTLTDIMHVGPDGVWIGNPTGTAEGAGTLNIAGSLYANGVAPTGTGGYVRAISPTITGTLTVSAFNLLGSSTGYTSFVSANAGASNFTLTFPAATDTVVTLAATQSLSNKTIASPAISGTATGSFTLSGNISHTGQNISSGTSAPASAAGQTVVMGTIAAPTLANNGQGFLFNTTAGGVVLEGSGSSSDVILANKSGSTVASIPTGTTKLNLPSLSSGTCASGLGLDSGNNTVLVSCPGGAGSIQVGTTTVTSGTNNNILTSGTGTLANVTVASLLTAGTNISITGTTNATINANPTESYCNGSIWSTATNAGTVAVCKTVVAVTIDNITAVTATPTAPSNFQFVVKDCGTSANNCASPTSTIGSVTTSNTANTAVDGTVSTSAVAAGHYLQILQGSGSCTFCAYSISVGMH